MKKLIALYKAPTDHEAFLSHYRDRHMPLVSQLPGLVKTEVTLVKRTLIGEQGSFLLAEMYFDNDDSFRTAMKSPENAALGADLKNFADGLVTVMTGDVI